MNRAELKRLLVRQINAYLQTLKASKGKSLNDEFHRGISLGSADMSLAILKKVSDDRKLIKTLQAKISQTAKAKGYEYF